MVRSVFIDGIDKDLCAILLLFVFLVGYNRINLVFSAKFEFFDAENGKQTKQQ